MAEEGLAARWKAGAALMPMWELAWGGCGAARGPSTHTVRLAPFPSAMAKFAGPRLPLVMKELVCTQSSVYEIQRVTSTAFLAEVVACCGAWGWGTPSGGRPRLCRPCWALRGDGPSAWAPSLPW